MKIIVYTVNIGGYDKLNHSPLHIFPQIDQSEYEFLYFTDGEAPKGWTKVEHKTGGRKDSRFYKINSHLLPPHDVSIYLDACYVIHKPFFQLTSLVENADIALCKHWHGTLANHAEMVVKLNLDSEEVVSEQMKRYGDVNAPLTENGLIIRLNNDKIKELNEMWWAEYQIGSQRDQFSLPYVIEQVKPIVNYTKFSARENKWMTWRPEHLKPRTINAIF